jgi:hypothetical protein
MNQVVFLELLEFMNGKGDEKRNLPTTELRNEDLSNILTGDLISHSKY